MRLTALLVLCVLVLIMGIAPASGAQNRLLQQTPAPCVNSVTVWDNDTLTGIAARAGVNAGELATANGLTPNARLRIGDVLCLDGLVVAQPGTPTTGTPATATPATRTPTATPSGTATPQPATGGFMRGQSTTVPTGWGTHVVGQGETLSSIASRYNLTTVTLAQANNIPDASVIYLGETLLIPPSNTTSAPGNIPGLMLNPRQAAPGGTITVMGSNYPPNATVELRIEKPSQNLRSAVLETVTVSATGTFEEQISIPTAWPDGAPVNQTTVSVSGYAVVGGYWAMNFFINSGVTGQPSIPTATPTPATPAPGVTPTAPATPISNAPIVTLPNGPNTIPIISLNPTQAQSGDVVTVTGTNFLPNTTVEIFIERPSFGLKSNALGTATTNAQGVFTYNLTVPETWPDGTPVNQNIVSVSAYTPQGFWGMNYFVNTGE